MYGRNRYDKGLKGGNRERESRSMRARASKEELFLVLRNVFLADTSQTIDLKSGEALQDGTRQLILFRPYTSLPVACKNLRNDHLLKMIRTRRDASLDILVDGEITMLMTAQRAAHFMCFEDRLSLGPSCFPC